MAKKNGSIRIGIGGWTFEPWRGTFYPEGLVQKRELEYASGKLGTIEINGTFYGTQKPDSFRKWHDETPDDFVFALKGPRFTTNRRVLADAGESIERFMTSGVLLLGDKLGPINWQLPPTKSFDAEDFEAFLKLFPRSVEGRAVRHAVEVRHRSFLTPDVVAIARRHEIAIVLAGDSEYPLINDPTAPFVYARIMGTRDGEPNGYSAAELDAWAARARAWAEGADPGLDLLAPAPKSAPRDVFLFVISGAKHRNPQAAMALIERLSQ